MQVQGVTLSQNSYQQKHNPNFTAIKSVKWEGLYKKHPELANDLVEAFKQNPKAMEFCKKYDVDIVFYAIKKAENYVESSIHIFFDNIAKSKTKRFFSKLFGNHEDKVVLHAWGNGYPISDCMKRSTEELVNMILPESKSMGAWHGGMLDSHLKSADGEIQKVLNARAQKAQKIEAELAVKKKSEEKLHKANSKLTNSINDLIEKGQ